MLTLLQFAGWAGLIIFLVAILLRLMTLERRIKEFKDSFIIHLLDHHEFQEKMRQKYS